jgi:hypothetical protein
MKKPNKILQGASEALAVAQGDIPTISKIKVTPSCGCVFCDVGLKPHDDGIHRANGHEVRCHRVVQ